MFRYANVPRVIGEIVVIVIGILLALAADTWMQDREQRHRRLNSCRPWLARLVD
jgi:type II secretory pathway pseudopilin PulG